MATFDADTLRELQERKEVAIRTEKHPDTAVMIWVVVADGEAFVRSFHGSNGRWYRDLVAGRFAALEIARGKLPVRAVPASDPTSIEGASRAYLSKYRSSSYAQAMVKPDLPPTTLRLIPR